ncbi:MAG: ABC transporter permease [Planctomycetaceae bacterium]|nr:ABC transporter permease [Planctomycetales bacterium]MCB9874256.1 ABC transporter permease [Planctomycetaceae bacterium]
MNDILYLAWRYLTYHRLKTIVLVASIAIIVYLPIGLNIVMSQSAKQLRGRAEATPLLAGAKGSPLELVLQSLYFETDVPNSIPYAEVARIKDSELATAIPLNVKFHSRNGPIVGTTGNYFDFRKLSVIEGRQIAMLGECVIGSDVARTGNLSIGDHIVSLSEDVFNIAGVYPLKMRIVGVLGPNDSPDDRAVFVDVKTTWIIEGLGHGHQELGRPETSDSGIANEANQVVTHTSVLQYNEITAENVSSFHFHGDTSTFPITAIIAVPDDEKANALLQGRYLGDDEEVQIVRPAEVMEKLLHTIFTVGRYVTFAVTIVGLSTLATMTLVFVLSLQLRRRELETMMKIGASRQRVVCMLGAEVFGVLILGACLAGVLALATSWFAGSALRVLIHLS